MDQQIETRRCYWILASDLSISSSSPLLLAGHIIVYDSRADGYLQIREKIVAAEFLVFDFERLCWPNFVIGLELCRSAPGTVSKRVGAPFMKLNGKYRVIIRPYAEDILYQEMLQCSIKKRTNKFSKNCLN